MGEFDRAVRALLEAELRCPHCGEMNVPKATPILEPEQDGSYTCRTCSTNFRPKEDR